MRTQSTSLLLRQLAQRPCCAGALPKAPRTTTQTRHFRQTALLEATPFQPKINRFSRFEESAQEIRGNRAHNPLDYVNNHKNYTERNRVLKRRILLGVIASGLIIAAQAWIVFTDDTASTSQPNSRTDRLDGPSGINTAALANAEVIVQTKPGQPTIKLDDAGHEYVETGTSSIPHFPKHISLPSPHNKPSGALPAASESAEDEYTLLGLGIRTVSFLSIQVYVLGLYIRTSDLPTLQAAFVHHVNPTGSTLIPHEKEALREKLLSGDGSLEVWDAILRTAKVRSAVRIVPTRGTDFAHLRDGWVRGITARTQEASKRGVGAEFEDEGFGAAMGTFKGVFGGKGKAPKGSTVLLMRDEGGRLGVLYEAEVKQKVKGETELKPIREVMGGIEDERIGRLVWLGYLGGKTVSSEGARKSIVDGVVELVERPIGSVGMQVL